MSTSLRRGDTVALVSPLDRLAGHERLPVVGRSLGVVIGVQIGTGDVLVKWVGRAHPLAHPVSEVRRVEV